MKEKEEYKKKYEESMRKHLQISSETASPPFSQLLKDLMQTAISNAHKRPGGYRYNEPIKEIALQLYSLGSPQAYEYLCQNLPFPSLTTVRRLLLSSEIVKEGEFRIKALKNYLVKRNLPLEIWVSEDATNIKRKAQYDKRTNQVLGFPLPLDKNGRPVVDAYPATTAHVIKSYFEEKTTASYAYAFMAQPLANDAPPFCLALFCSDSKFTSQDVRSRWVSLIKEAKEEGLLIIGFSSDGDPRLLKAMLDSEMPCRGDWNDWFGFSTAPEVVFLQDPVHIITKLKTRLLKPSIILPMGENFCASKGDLVELLNICSKDQHNLCMSALNSKDKMNFSSAEKMCSVSVTSNLEDLVAGSKATVTYLKLMRSVLIVFLDDSLLPLDRVLLLWEWIFFLRHWRAWVDNHPDYTVAHNFLSSNTYNCLELNAHALIQVIRKFRNMGKPELFAIWLMGSQPCEKFFRAARSITGSYSTVVNFTLLEMLHRLRRIERQIETGLSLSEMYNVPRLQKSKEHPLCSSLPEDADIERAVKEARANALSRAQVLGIAATNVTPPLFSFSFSDDVEDEDSVPAETAIDDDEDGMTEHAPEASKCDSYDDSSDDEMATVEEDLCVVSSGAYRLRTFDHVDVSPTSHFVKVQDGLHKDIVIAKTTLCWMLNEGVDSLSSDRLQRVKASQTHPRRGGNIHQRKPHKEDFVYIGDWCAFKSEDGSTVVGRILDFSYLSGRSWSDQQYSLTSAPTKPPQKNARGLGCLCSWYGVSNTILRPIKMDTHGYYDLKNYLFTVPRPSFEDDVLALSCSLKTGSK